MLTRLAARMLINECHGNEIWSPETCREKRVPEAWIDELTETYESGFQSDQQTIYIGDQITNQYRGVRDLHLAYRLAEFLGVDTARVAGLAIGAFAEVRALKEAVEES